MCGRYRRTTSEEELARLYHIPIPSQTDLPDQLQYCAEPELEDPPPYIGSEEAGPRLAAIV